MDQVTSGAKAKATRKKKAPTRVVGSNEYPVTACN